MNRSMRNKAFALAAVSVLAVAVAVAVGSGAANHRGIVAASLGSAAASPARPAAPPDDTRPLKERAKGAGRFVVTEKSHPPAYQGLNELAANSSAVVIGTPQDNVCRLTPDGRSITIDYRVSVRHTYKGGLKEGDTITVSLPGGAAVLDDGTRVEVQTPWFKKMQDGKTYALFLNDAGGRAVFKPTGGPQGVFEIPVTKESRAVKSHSGVQADPIWAYHGMDVFAFLKEVRKATGR